MPAARSAPSRVSSSPMKRSRPMASKAERMRASVQAERQGALAGAHLAQRAEEPADGRVVKRADVAQVDGDAR